MSDQDTSLFGLKRHVVDETLYRFFIPLRTNANKRALKWQSLVFDLSCLHVRLQARFRRTWAKFGEILPHWRRYIPAAVK